MKPGTYTILIADQSQIGRRGLQEVLLEKNNASLNVEVCALDAELEKFLKKCHPQVLIISPDSWATNEGSIAAYKKNHTLLVVAFVYSFQHPEDVSQFDAAIYWNDEQEKVQGTIDQLLKKHPEAEGTAEEESLSKREKEILKLMVSGYTTKKIADELFISVHTVNSHRKNIMNKLDIKTVSGLTIYAVLNNIISLKEV